MRILIVAATDLEVAPMVERMRPAARAGRGGANSYTYGAHDVDVLITGVGMVATAARSSRALTAMSYDLALNFGVCGSFDEFLDPGTVVHVVSDRIAELGAEDGDRFLTLEELKLPGESVFQNLQPPANPEIESLLEVEGITVNTVHGAERSIAAVTARFNPQVESMEGAGFMSACLMHRIAFAQVRAVSNVIERRNRESWKVAEAIVSLNASALRILDQA